MSTTSGDNRDRQWIPARGLTLHHTRKNKFCFLTKLKQFHAHLLTDGNLIRLYSVKNIQGNCSPGVNVINYTHPFMVRRQLLGLSLIDVQSHLSRQGFTFSVETLAAFEHGERRFPVENPGFLVAMSQCLEIPAVHAWQTSRQATNALQAQHQFWN